MYILTVNSPITLCQNFTYLLTRLEKSRPKELRLLQKGLIRYTDGSRTWRRTGAKSKGNLLQEGSVSLYKNKLQFSRSRYMPFWTVHMKFVQMLDQRNTLVFALIVRQLWKPFRLLKQCPHWYNSAKRHWMTFPLGILCDCSGSPDTLGYVEKKLPSSF